MTQEILEIGSIIEIKNDEWKGLSSSRYRIDGYYRAVPLCPPDIKFGAGLGMEFTSKFCREKFFEKHPDWNHEYRLEWCSKEQATHYDCGTRYCPIENAIFVRMVSWNAEALADHIASHNFYIELEKRKEHFDHIIVKGEYHA